MNHNGEQRRGCLDVAHRAQRMIDAKGEQS